MTVAIATMLDIVNQLESEGRESVTGHRHFEIKNLSKSP